MTDVRRTVSGLLWLVVPAAAGAQSAPPPQVVRVDAARLERVLDRRLVIGELRAARSAAVAGREPGLVVELPVREGQRVAKGDVLARLDARRLELELAQVEADRAVGAATLVERRADVALRTWQHDAFKELASRGSSYEQELREAEAAIAVANAKVEQAKQQLAVIDARRALLDQRIADTVVTAPFDATVVARRVERGGWLGPGDAVVEVVSADEVEAWFEVPESLAAAVARADVEIEVRLTALDRTLHATAFRVVPQVDAQTRTFPVIVPLVDSGGVFKPGMSATAWLPTGAEQEHLTISKNAVLRNDAGSYVYVARSGAAGSSPLATPVPIEPLFFAGDRVAVRAAGLRAGERLVVEGNERLFPQMPLAPVDAGNGGK